MPHESGLHELRLSHVAHHDSTLAFPSSMIMSLNFRIVAFAWGAEIRGKEHTASWVSVQHQVRGTGASALASAHIAFSTQQ